MTLRVINPRVEQGGLSGRHVLGAFLSFFAIIFAVNGYFLYAALSTHTGVVANEPYRKGLAYNERIAASEKQAGLAWTDTLDVGIDGRVVLAIKSAEGIAQRGLVIEGTLGRPSTDRQDHALRFVERDGDYFADVGALEPGAWIVSVSASRAPGDEPVFRARRRLWLKQ